MKPFHFVFVVCGAKEHIDTLNYSLLALKKFSKTSIYVLTDTSRNKEKINHDAIIDIPTPKKYDAHQASIFLKTSLHKYLPLEGIYCYLDTDVVALNSNVDTIFSKYTPPILFAPDHCKANEFSLSATHCGCQQQFNDWQNELQSLFKQHQSLSRPPENLEKKKQLEQKLIAIKKNKIHYQWISWRFNWARRKFKLSSDFIFDKKTRVWHDKFNHPVLYENKTESAIDIIEKNSRFRCDKTDLKPWTFEGKNVFAPQCTHLHEAIKKQFGIEVLQADWQHWNGGVFLFDEKSHAFLNDWHNMTLQIFELPEWKTRDQGTLIATAWKHQLENHPVLPHEYNFIVDYGHQKRIHKGNLLFDILEVKKNIYPHFIHVYHHWGDPHWDVWQEIESTTKIHLHPDTNTFNALWIGNTLSAIELLTLQSFIDNNHRIKLWIYEPLLTPLPKGVILEDANKIIPKNKIFAYKNKNKYGHGQGSYAGFSDIFRYKLLYEYGGWWTDMDITCLQPIYTPNAYFFRAHHELKMVGNVMKCPKGSPLMRKCYEESLVAIDENNTDWHLPINILNENIVHFNLQHYIVSDISNHDQWEETQKLIWSEISINKKWWFIHWQNEEWRVKKIDKNDFYYRSTLAQLLIKHAVWGMPFMSVMKIMNRIKHHPLLRQLKAMF